MKLLSSGISRVIFAQALSMLLACCLLLGGCSLKTDNKLIKEGVSIAGVNVGGMSRKEAISALSGYEKFHEDMILRFECEDVGFNIDASQLSVRADTEASAQKAYLVGRGEDKKKNKADIKKARKQGINLGMEILFDFDKLTALSADYLGGKTKDPSPMSVEIGDDCLVVTNSVAGMIIDEESAKRAISSELGDLKADESIVLILKEHKIPDLTFDEFKQKYVREAKDAVYTKKGETHNIEPEVVGVEIDDAKARKIFEENRNSTEPYTIPARITRPSVTASYLEDKYVNKIMAKYSTSFAGSSANRITNIALAASKIDGYVVNPGKRFSYNAVVGPRTEAAGFKSAHVYVGTKVVDGLGGGICQVSSTLYNAVVLADLKTVTRVNHSIPVNYVPLGRDATVSYGTIDYVFENNKPYPISIKAKLEGSTLTISIVGTSEMDYTVEFVSEFVSSIPYGTTNIEDDNMAEGETRVVSPGSNGSVYQSYRVYKKNGKVYDRKSESKSRYQPVAQEVAVGTVKQDMPEDNEAENTEVADDTAESKTEIAPSIADTDSKDAEKATSELPIISYEDETDTKIVHPENDKEESFTVTEE